MKVKKSQSAHEVLGLATMVAEQHLKPEAAEYDRSGKLPLENIKRLGECGLMGLMVPPEYGGLGGTINPPIWCSRFLHHILQPPEPPEPPVPNNCV